MGLCSSSRSKSRVYAADEDPLVEEWRAKAAARVAADGGIPIDQLNDLLRDIGDAPLEGAALEAAGKQLDPTRTGRLAPEAFLAWFRGDRDDGAPRDEPPHPSVVAGLKDEGEASGTGGYDDELLRPPPLL